MTIQKLNRALAGMQPASYWMRQLTTVAGQTYSLAYGLNSTPGQPTSPIPGVAGVAVTSFAGGLPYTSITTGLERHLVRFSIQANGSAGLFLLCDRLWHNSGLSVTSTASQTVNSVAWPARDVNGTSNGDQVLVGVEVVANIGAGVPSLSLTYTNSAGVAGRTSSNTVVTVASPLIGRFYPFGLQAGDVGVRSIQSYKQSATWTSGGIALVAYRILAIVEMPLNAGCGVADFVTGGFPRLYANTVPWIISYPSQTTSGTVYQAWMVYTDG